VGLCRSLFAEQVAEQDWGAFRCIRDILHTDMEIRWSSFVVFPLPTLLFPQD
jgi:hypothetical protein